MTPLKGQSDRRRGAASPDHVLRPRAPGAVSVRSLVDHGCRATGAARCRSRDQRAASGQRSAKIDGSRRHGRAAPLQADLVGLGVSADIAQTLLPVGPSGVMRDDVRKAVRLMSQRPGTPRRQRESVTGSVSSWAALATDRSAALKSKRQCKGNNPANRDGVDSFHMMASFIVAQAIASSTSIGPSPVPSSSGRRHASTSGAPHQNRYSCSALGGKEVACE